eukprot:3813013-Rhodomonas_salina.1
MMLLSLSRPLSLAVFRALSLPLIPSPAPSPSFRTLSRSLLLTPSPPPSPSQATSACTTP